MSIQTLHLTQYDLQPAYPVKVIDSSGAAIDLTGATIRCTMGSISVGALKINRQTTGIVIANQATNKGEFEYQWQTNDTDTPNSYYIEFEITPASGGKFTVPCHNDGKAKVVISAGLDSQ
ncbi:MAG: hypothetical protein A2W23_01255 [Planctomycetes bacterium RBG_16_43_13]|nr:MAG: hypothetical protein A2W23_01255 [Planctomycetes bacterium RBG_16_43_13]